MASGSHTTEFTSPQDWGLADDPTEKKRVQNRIAQRMYRHRLKQHLHDLQARVDLLQRQHAAPTNDDAVDSNQATAATSRDAVKPLGDEISLISLRACSGDHNRAFGYQNDGVQNAQWLVARCSPQPQPGWLNVDCTEDELQGRSFKRAGQDANVTAITNISQWRRHSNSSMSTYPGSMVPVSKGTLTYDKSVNIDPEWSSKVAEGCRELDLASLCKRYDGDSDLNTESRLGGTGNLPMTFGDISTERREEPNPGRPDIYDDVLEISERMLVFEFTRARDGLLSTILPSIRIADSSSQTCAAALLMDMKKQFQNDLPNSWTMMQAIASNIGPNHQDSSNIPVAIILMLLFAGRASNERLLQMVSTCISGLS